MAKLLQGSAVASGFLSSECVYSSEPNPNPGSEMQKAPDLRLKTDQGEIRLADQKVRLIYLDFWASWCTPCKLSFPWMQSLDDRYKVDGLGIIAINLDQHREDAAKFLKANSPSFTIAYDPTAQSAKLMGLKTMPSAWIIRGKDLQILQHHAGFRASDPKRLEPQIQHFLSSTRSS